MIEKQSIILYIKLYQFNITIITHLIPTTITN